MSLEILLALAVVVFLAYAVQTVTGFGSMLLCVTFGAHLLDIQTLVTLAVPISLIQTGYIALRHRRFIEWPLLLRRVLPLMGVGLAAGLVAQGALGGDPLLRYAFGAMVFVLAARELWVLHGSTVTDRAKAPPAASMAAMLGAGVIHGIYATGGPLLVYAVGREDLDKHRFRATLSMVWLVLGLALAAAFLGEGRYDLATGLDILVLLPAVPLGIVLGEWLHAKVEERRFKTTVFALLIAASVSLLLR